MFRSELREQTHEVHQQLHHHSHFVALFDGSISKPQYVALLQRFHGFYAPMEAAIDRALWHLSDLPDGFSYSSRTALLHQDLADLGFSAAQIAQNPQCSGIAKVVKPETLGGVFYVIEGSTLGASLIDRAAQKILEKGSVRGRSFWAWSRAHNKERWAAANAYLDHLEHLGRPVETTVFGAQSTFAALASWLEPLENQANSSEGVLC